MQQELRVAAAVTALALSASLPSAYAVIPAGFKMQKLAADSGWVLLGKFTEAKADKKLLTVELTEAVKGPAPAAPVRVLLRDVPDAAEFLAGLKPGQPVVLLAVLDAQGAPNSGLLHLGNRWLRLTPPTGTVKVWLAARELALPGSFPGSTESLATLMRDLKAGRDTLNNDELDPKSPGWAKPTLKPLGTLPAGTEAVTAMPIYRGEAGKVTLVTTLLLAWSADGPRELVLTDGELRARPDDPAKAELARADREAALQKRKGLLDAATAAGLPAPLAVLPGSFVGPDGAAVIWPERVGLFAAEAGKTSFAVDHVAVSGLPTPRAGSKIIAAGSGDLNGDGRTDLYLAFDIGEDWVCLNRGYGVFFAHSQTPLVQRMNWKLPDGSAAPAPKFVAIADIDGDGAADIVYVAADGRAFGLLRPMAK